MSPQLNPQPALVWQNLHLNTPGFTSKVILASVSGSIIPGTLSSIMGPSGAGKTTLLNALSGNLSSSQLLPEDSAVYLNLAEVGASPQIIFIEQHPEGTISGRLTVGQLLRYAYRFKNNRSSIEEMNVIIERTLARLMLHPDILHQPFGKCSGGEQKRIAIAQELLLSSSQKASFLFIDEPTTGLDSASAYEVMYSLKGLAAEGHLSVVVSIHLPSTEILNLFDQLYVLAKGGVCIYSGRPSELPLFLQKHLSEEVVAIGEKPIEGLLEIACRGAADAQVMQLRQACRGVSVSSQLLNTLKRQPFGVRSQRKLFSPSDLALHICRLLRITFFANGIVFFGQLIFYNFIILMLTTLFNHQMVRPSGCYPLANQSTSCHEDLKKDSLLQENMNYLCILVLATSYLVASTCPTMLAPLLRGFRSEHRNYWYSTSVFYLSTLLVTILQLSAVALSVASFGYVLSEQHAVDLYTINWSRFGHFFAVIWITCVYSYSFGLLISCLLLGAVEIATLLTQVVVTFLVLFNDFFFNVDDTGSAVLIAISDLVAFKYVTKYLLYVFYGVDRCDPETEFSLVLAKHYVDSSQMTYYISRVVANILIIQLITWMYMCFRFSRSLETVLSMLRKLSSMKLFRWCFPKKMLPFDENNNLKIIDMSSVNTPIFTITSSKLRPQSILIAWRNLTLYTSRPLYERPSSSSAHEQNRKPILRSLSGELRFGTLSAIMGPSGAGKTSLLRVLNGQAKGRLSHGTDFYLTRLCPIRTCFVTQSVDGHLLPGLTALQALLYASKLKNVSSIQLNHRKVALKWLSELHLVDIADTKVEHCSGGERKRLALALELTSAQMPNLICIDEPTSGLDSSSAEVVITCLRMLAVKHRLAILTSIHQPNSKVLSLFDQLLVLARGGLCIYAGAPENLGSHLKGVLHKQQYTGLPIEQLIRHSCAGPEDPVVQKLVQHVQRCPESELKAATVAVPEGVPPNRTRFNFRSVYVLFERHLRYLYGFFWLETLFFLTLYIGYAVSLRFVFPPAIALPSGCLDFDADTSTSAICNRTAEVAEAERDLEKNFKYNIFMCNMFQFIVLIHQSLTFGKELPYVHNERRNGWYSVGAWYLMKSIIEVLIMLPVVFGYLAISDLYSPIRPGIYPHLVLVLCLAVLAWQAIGHICATISTGQVLMLFTTSLFLLSTLLSNFFISIPELHYFYRTLSNCLPGRWSFEGFIVLQYGFGRCGSREIQQFLWLMDVEDEDYIEALWMLTAILILARIVAIGVLLWKVAPKEERKRKQLLQIELLEPKMKPNVTNVLV